MKSALGAGSGLARVVRATPPSASELSRRLFVSLVMSATGGALLGCSGSKSSAELPAGSSATDDAPYGIWEKLRTAVRASPDHLSASAARLVAAKDPTAIFEFVRDQIATYPTEGDVVTAMRWGARGTLRGGAGTPREKAELLVSLYQQAGFDARVVFGGAVDDMPGTTALATQVYLRSVERKFEPAVDDATLVTWKSELEKVGTVPDPSSIDPDDSERSALVATIMALLPSDAAASIGAYDATLGTVALSDIPLVALTVEGKVRYANPLFPGLAFGMSGTNDTPTDAPASSAAPAVVVELFASTTLDPLNRISLVKGSYAAEDLAGRQILAQFVPATDIETLANLRLVDIHAFQPMLSLRGPDVDSDTQSASVNVGPTFTTRGEIISVDKDGSVAINGKTVLAVKEQDAGAAKRVMSLAVDVRSGGYPTIQLVVEALDAKGKPVLGLPASSFRVSDSGTPVGFSESATPSAPIRVLLAFDLDDPLGSGEDPLDFARALTSAVLAAYPDAVMVTGEPGSFVESSDSEAVALGASTSNAMGDSDNPWQVLADAATEAPTVVVIVSDFIDLTDPNDPSARPRGTFRDIVAAGPPIIAIDTAPPPSDRNPIADQIIALTGGAYLPGVGSAAGVQAVLDLLAQQKAGGAYTLDYTAPEEGPSKRVAKVSVGAVSGAGSYTISDAEPAALALTLAGLYLSVSLGDVTVTRVLGGYPSLVTPPADGERLPQAVLDDVRNGLFGVTLLSFEGGAPSLSTLLDDQLTLKLSGKPLTEAVVAQDSAAIRAALPKLGHYMPSELSRLHCALPANSAASATYENGLRIIAYSNRPRFGVGQERRVDVLPLADWSSVSEDAATSFQDTLARTARVAVVEGHTYAHNTLKALAGKKLRLLDVAHIDASELPYAPDVAASASELLSHYEGYAGYYRLLPDGKEFVGFWAVHRQTGTLLGVQPDGSGGASQPDECGKLSDLNSAFDALGLLAELGGMGVLGPFFLLGKEVAAVALLSAALLGDQDGTLGGKDPNAAINGLAANAGCEVAKLGGLNAASSYGGKLGEIANKADAIGSVAGASPSCPNALSGVGC